VTTRWTPGVISRLALTNSFLASAPRLGNGAGAHETPNRRASPYLSEAAQKPIDKTMQKLPLEAGGGENEVTSQESSITASYLPNSITVTLSCLKV